MNGISEEEINSEEFLLEENFCKGILAKANELNDILEKNLITDEKYILNHEEMIDSTNKIIAGVSQSIDYFNNNPIFQNEFYSSINVIDTAYNAYIKSIKFIIDNQQQETMFQNFIISINNFIQSIRVFSNFIEEISNLIQSKGFDQNQLNIRIGIESSLFTFAVKVESTNEEPFYRSKFVEVYKCYDDIHNTKDVVIAIESVCGTGKTLCLPIILLCKSLKEKTLPFLIITQTGPKTVESKEAFFKKIYSKYLTIVSDPNELLGMYNEYDEKKENSKMVLAVLTPHNLLPLINQLKDNPIFYQSTRFIIDEVHQRPVFLDVLVANLASLNDQNIFRFPLNLILTSATISPQMLDPFKEKIKKISLIKSAPFEIVENKPIIETNIYKINNQTVCDTATKTIEKMAKIDSTIEKGHILCFLTGIGKCYKLRKSLISIFKELEENENHGKIIMLETLLKPNETIESYFRRLKEEYMLNENLKEGNNYKYDFIYFVPIVLSGNADDAIFKIAENEFPSDLANINKLICSTPMIESSFNIDKLSVVIDSGLCKETKFDTISCLTNSIEKQATKESMNQRKGRLGRTMKGLYIPIYSTEDEIPDFKVPAIQRNDFTTDFLILKSIGIDFEKMTNLPSKPNQTILKFAIDALINMGAIDQDTLEITKFGLEAVKYVYFPYIPIYYAAAIAKYETNFSNEKMNDMKLDTFIAAFISTVICMDNLIQENMTEKMSRVFNENSDIATIVNSLLILLKSDLTENDELRDLVESYGFSYTNYLCFKSHLQDVVNLISSNKTVSEYVQLFTEFLEKTQDITSLVDNFIPVIASVIPNWEKVHSITFKYVNGAGNFNSTPTIVFNGDNSLFFENRNQKNAEVKIIKRPGWNGIMIPAKCYCFSISRDVNSCTNYGHIIHRMNKNSSGEIASIECDKMALNPWFHVLLDTYLNESSLKIKYFTNVIKSSTYNRKSGPPPLEKRMFHYSNAGERVFVSFIPCNDGVKHQITNAIHKCLRLMPFTPRSILISRRDVKSFIEITSIGTQHYETSISSFVHAKILDARLIDYCIKNISELSKSNSTIRICALFAKKSCKSEYYDNKHLYIINTRENKWPLLSDIALKNVIKLNKTNKIKQLKKKDKFNNPNKLVYFQFPPRFLHPALMYDKKSRDSIIDWITNKCDYVHVVKIVGDRFLIKQSEVQILQEHLKNDKEQIQKEMNLSSVAIPVPFKAYSKAYVTIRDHPTWKYSNRFKVIVTSKEESDQVNEFIDSIKEQLKNENDKSDEITETLCCLYVCDDPDDPLLTKYPITIYYKDGSSYTNKMCRDCIVNTLQNATESFYTNGKINHDALSKISIKLPFFPFVESKETDHGRECWPQIPFGQMISALIYNDDEMSGLISAWLRGISEFTVRVQEKDKFTFCPDHPSYIFNINLMGKNAVIECKDPDCHNIYCKYCLGWHDPNFICEEKKSGKSLSWNKKCPKCKVLTYKDGGCNHISCPCGCHWCYKCGAGFSNPDDCYSHMTKKHGGCFDYDDL